MTIEQLEKELDEMKSANKRLTVELEQAKEEASCPFCNHASARSIVLGEPCICGADGKARSALFRLNGQYMALQAKVSTIEEECLTLRVICRTKTTTPSTYGPDKFWVINELRMIKRNINEASIENGNGMNSAVEGLLDKSMDDLRQLISKLGV